MSKRDKGSSSSRPIIPYNPELKKKADYLRKHMTLAEVLLWKRLNQKKMCGYDFDRQRPIGEYIVDFYCKDLRLAIEIDGRSHDVKPDKDKRRQERLESLGARFLRFWDQNVKHDMDTVLRTIREWIEENEKLETSV
jgi:very-short-patch-repair endonuclease